MHIQVQMKIEAPTKALISYPSEKVESDLITTNNNVNNDSNTTHEIEFRDIMRMTRERERCGMKLLPIYESYKPILWISDIYYMSYQSNLLNREELTDIRTLSIFN